MSGAAWLAAAAALCLVAAWLAWLGWRGGGSGAAAAAEAALAPAFLAGLASRSEWQGLLAPAWQFWAPCLAMLAGLPAWGRLLLARDGRGAGQALAWGQASWLALALFQPSGAAQIGGLNLLLWQVLLRQPLQRLLEEEGSRRPWTLLLGLLALVGAPPFALMSAYFYLFVPFMSSAAAVHDMHSRLFTASGLLAGLATLCVVYQTGALGYFYWSRILNAERAAPLGRRGALLVWTGLALAVLAGWRRAELNVLLRQAAAAAGVVLPSG